MGDKKSVKGDAYFTNLTLKPVKEWLVGLDPAWRAALPVWAAARLGLGLWAAWIWLQRLMPDTAGWFYFSVAPVLEGWQGAVLGMWQRWDGIHYQFIAEQFYTNDLSAFFPAYPVLGDFVARVTGLPPLGGLVLLSAGVTLLDFVLLYEIARDLFSHSAAVQTLICVILFPTSFFLFGIFPQSLALLWMLLAYRQAGRGRWLSAGLAGLLAGLTHGTVVPLAAMLFVQALQSMGRDWGAFTAQEGTPPPVPPRNGEGRNIYWRFFAPTGQKISRPPVFLPLGEREAQGRKRKWGFFIPSGQKISRPLASLPLREREAQGRKRKWGYFAPSGQNIPRPLAFLPFGEREARGGKIRWEVLLKGMAMMGVAGLPLLGMGLFLAWREWMGFPAYFSLQETAFSRVFSAPWETVWMILQQFPGGVLQNWVLGLNTLELALAVASVIWGWRFLPAALNVYQVVFLLFILSSRGVEDPLVCFNRYIVVLFPMFLVMGRQKMGTPGKLIYFGFSLLLVLGVSAMFFMWKWVG